jgi:hypothetical protein
MYTLEDGLIMKIFVHKSWNKITSYKVIRVKNKNKVSTVKFSDGCYSGMVKL